MSHGNGAALMDRISTTNKLNAANFIEDYLRPAANLIQLPPDVCLSFATNTNISTADFDACFNLVRSTSRAAYKASSRGWSSRQKKCEMLEQDMKYLMVYSIAQDPPSSGRLYEDLNLEDSKLRPVRGQPSAVIGFLSFMLTHEDGIEVIYCYEIHLQSEFQGRGLGFDLMRIMELIGRTVGVNKAMLTVFTSNQIALDFYDRVGYQWYDEEQTPTCKSLRSGVTEKPRPTYVILAKDLK